MHRTFTQTLHDLTVNISLDAPTKAKELDVEITSKNVAVVNRTTGLDVFRGDFYASVNVDGSTWYIENGVDLVLNLEKQNSAEYWPHVILGDPKIDTTKIKPEPSKLSDLEGDTRATVEKMMFDQRQQQMGLPTSDELRKQKLLDRFKQMHPELDFSKVN